MSVEVSPVGKEIKITMHDAEVVCPCSNIWSEDYGKAVLYLSVEEALQLAKDILRAIKTVLSNESDTAVLE